MSADELATDLAQPQRPPRELAPGQFSIAALLMLTLWVALCLAAYRMFPVIGASIGLWTVPATIRALYSVQYWRRRRGAISWGDVYDIYGSSLVLMAAAELSGLIAFGLTGLVILVISSGIGLPLGIAAAASMWTGLIAGVSVAAVALWVGRPSRFDKPS